LSLLRHVLTVSNAFWIRFFAAMTAERMGGRARAMVDQAQAASSIHQLGQVGRSRQVRVPGQVIDGNDSREHEGKAGLHRRAN
jgi:hypothetical protein